MNNSEPPVGEPKNFNSRLSRLRRRWQAGSLVCIVLRVLGWALVALVVYSVLDFFLAFGSGTRFLLDILMVILFACLAIARMASVFALTGREMARRADSLLGSRRQGVLSAFELASWLDRKKERREGLYYFLVQQSVNKAWDDLKSLRYRDHFPLREIGKQLKVLLIQMCLAAAVLCSHSAAAGIVLQRIAYPYRDIPPYSKYAFTVSPETPSVLYGSGAEIEVEITGGPLSAQVWFLTRSMGKTHRTACFQEGRQHFAQRLEKVVSPIEFCFTMGRARSKWYKTDLLLEPMIAVASVTVYPPAYSRLPKRQFFVGNEYLAGLKQSRMELSVTSNRPLLDGSLTIRSKSDPDSEQVVAGMRTGPQTVSFEWVVKETADLEVFIRDVRGTKNRDPLKLDQKLMPDEPPEAAITEPSGFSLATPDITLQLAGYAEDDLGLRRAELVRTLVGYRDRIKSLGLETVQKHVEFRKELDLRALGTKPGQVLEFYMEASDLNPSMMGIGASDVVRVQIISGAEYAAMLRARTTIEEFLQRYRVVESQMSRLKNALRELKEAAESGGSTALDLDEKLNKARDLGRQTAELFEKIAHDFTVYDIEKDLADALGHTVQMLRNNAQTLDKADPTTPGLSGLAGDLLRNMGESEAAVQTEVGNAETVAMIARVMECAGRFRMLVEGQTELVRRLSRFSGTPRSEDFRLLASLGRREEKLRGELVKLVHDLDEQAGKLPNLYYTLRSSAVEFAKKIEKNEIEALMGKSVLLAGNQDGGQAHRFATLALEKLEELMDDPDSCFGGLCRGGMKFSVPKDLESTMKQMLAGILARMAGSGVGQGMGPGHGWGIGVAGGAADDGYWMSGNSPLNIPVFGPDRMMFEGMSSSGVTGTYGSGQGAGAAGVGSTTSETMDAGDAPGIKSESMPLEQVPEKYRDAVKKYFSGEYE